MASVGSSLPGDRVTVKQRTGVRRYCDRTRTCGRTGEVSKCSAPLHWNGGPALSPSSWVCQVCRLVEAGPFGIWSIGHPRRVIGGPEENNGWCHRHPAAQFAGAPSMDQMTINERARIEASQRPRAVIENVEPYWACSNREVLDEMGITAEVLSMADAIAVHDVDQLDKALVNAIDSGRGARVVYTTEGISTHHEDREWRDTIGALHRYDSSWIDQVANALARHGGSKPRYTIAGPRVGTRAWRVVEMTAAVASTATVAYGVPFGFSFAHGVGAVSSNSPFHIAAVPSPGLPLQAGDVVSTEQQTVVDGAPVTSGSPWSDEG